MAKEKAKKDDQLAGLEGWLNIEASIECTKCDKGTNLDETDPEQDAYKKGWRVDDTECYCPGCVKKYLKSKK